MSKLRIAVTKTLLKLSQDVEPLQESAPVRRRRKRRAIAASDVGGHKPANDVDSGDASNAPDDEPQTIREARARLRGLIAAATKDAPRSSVGIVLAILNQETGNHAAANALIEELGLEKLFGIKKFCRNT